jgi:hypothetical protein
LTKEMQMHWLVTCDIDTRVTSPAQQLTKEMQMHWLVTCDIDTHTFACIE